MIERFWVSFPDRGGYMTSAWDIVDGTVRETYTAAPELRGWPWPEAVADLRRRFGDELRVERLNGLQVQA